MHIPILKRKESYTSVAPIGAFVFSLFDLSLKICCFEACCDVET